MSSPPCTNMKVPNGDGSAQTRRHGGSYPKIFFVPPKFCCVEKQLFQTYDKN